MSVQITVDADLQERTSMSSFALSGLYREEDDCLDEHDFEDLALELTFPSWQVEVLKLSWQVRAEAKIRLLQKKYPSPSAVCAFSFWGLPLLRRCFGVAFSVSIHLEVSPKGGFHKQKRWKGKEGREGDWKSLS